ncbi:MAG: peptidoglycan-associated lipoprotein Pal [Desulfobacterales bacterium]|nr:peptidoglycan-associated lipoprotein Pal [Desulfobacterales bacterium]
MQKKVWIALALFLILPGLLFTVSCAKKTVKTDEAAMTAPEETATQVQQEQTQQEEMASKQQADMEKQRALEAEKLAMQEAQRQAMLARQQFESENIYFEFDSSALLTPAQDTLSRKAQYLRENPNIRLIIEGHCDERGTDEYNLALGDRRANSAKSFLVDLGISPSRLTTISYGEERPLDPRHNEEAWAKNRRCEFVIE